MKKMFCLIILTSLLACGHKAQENSTSDYSALPSFNLLLSDSITKFNTGDIASGKAVILMYISTDCEHCHALTKELLKNINSLKDIQIYLFTPMPFKEMKQFSQDFRLEDYKNITVGNDYEYAFYRIYNATSFPCIAIYDKEKKLVKFYKGEVSIDKIVEATHI